MRVRIRFCRGFAKLGEREVGELVSAAVLTGAHVLAKAVRDLRPAFVGVVPGRPLTEAGRLLVSSGQARWITHEAVALQMALGAASSGGVAVAMVKQVGFNAGMDVAASSAVHRSGGAVIFVVGDDPGAGGSDVEGDARAFAFALELPCMEPAGGSDIAAAVVDAALLSARHRLPTVLRVTTQLMAAAVAPDCIQPPQLVPDPFPAQKYAPAETWTTDPLGQRARLHMALRAISHERACVRHHDGADLHIVASGYAAQEAVGSGFASLLVRRPVPIPEAELREFAQDSSGSILVLEDGLPFLERAMRECARDRVLGRLTGHVPAEGPLAVGDIIAAAAAGERAAVQEHKVERFSRKALRGLGSVFSDLASLGLVPIACDAGMCGIAPYLMPDVAPLSYGLGSAIGTAAGVALRKGRAIAVIGDMGFFHAGIVGLLQVVRDQLPVLTIIHDNGVAAYTGGQPHVGSTPKPGQVEVSAADVARGVGVRWVERVPSDDAVSEVLRPLLGSWAADPKPGVLIIDDRASRMRVEH